MNGNSILSEQSQAPEIVTKDEAAKKTADVTATAAPESPNCKNGVCLVTWKPQRPVAA